jgi:galactonate dehydratase
MNAAGAVSPVATQAEVDAMVSRAASAREVLGSGGDLAIDFHGRFTFASARRAIAGLVDLGPLFIEEPLVPEQSHLLRELVRASPVSIAAGERAYDRAAFLQLLQAGVIVVQPDLSHAGGISEVRRIATLADTFGALLAPHCPLGPIALAACLQVAFMTPNFLIQEQSLDIHYNRGADLLTYVSDASPFTFVDGYAPRTLAHGLGVEIDEASVREADTRGHAWRNPVWRHADGSFAEW